jgi:MFS family permease
MFHLANAAMLPLMSSVVTMRSRDWATVLVAACIVVPQLGVAAISPWVGRRAQEWGRRPLLLMGFGALLLRGLLFATLPNPYLLVAAQALDGISAAVIGIMGPLVVADLTRGTGRFNLSQGVIGTAVGLGASLSTTLAGYMSDHLGNETTFLGLAAVAGAGLALVFALMPETREKKGG